MVVFFNALSGTIAYARLKRIDYRIGFIFSLATIPGAVLGALATTAVSRERFDLWFGFLLLAIAIGLVISPAKESATRIAQTSYRSSSVGSLDIPISVIGAQAGAMLSQNSRRVDYSQPRFSPRLGGYSSAQPIVV